jgi:hypothetical protein
MTSHEIEITEEFLADMREQRARAAASGVSRCLLDQLDMAFEEADAELCRLRQSVHAASNP